jgi:hypothetical protein
MSGSPFHFTFRLLIRASYLGLTTCLLLLLCLTLDAETAKAQSFSNPATYSVGDNPNGGASGDFNGDNKPDLAIGNVLNKNVSVLLNKGDGTFNNAVNYETDFNPESVTTGDFNGDGKLDLAVGNFYGGFTSSGNISILLGNGNGTFQTAVNYDASSPISLKAADLNADGKLDLAAASWTANKASVLLGNGDGTFQAVTTYTAGSEPRGIAIADFNGDNKPDLAVTSFVSSNVSILLGNGNGTFQSALNTPTPTPIGLVAADLNGDSKQDLILAAVSSASIYVMKGNGDGSFQPGVSYSVGSEPQHLELADFNGDSIVDVVAVNANSASFSVLRGNGDATFQAAMTRASRIGSFSPIVADFDTDGKPDLAILSNAFDVVDVFLNSPNIRSFAFSAVAGAPATNVLVGRFIDYDTTKTAAGFTATVDWGDGTTPTSGVVTANSLGGFDVNASHTYAKEGVYNFTVRLADSNGNFASTTNTATVSDAALTATGVTIAAMPNESFTGVVAHFTDADPTGTVSEFSATIDWGDGSNSAGTISVNGSGGFDVSGTHTYSNSGSFAIVVNIHDVGGSTATANSTANVAPAPPWIQFKFAEYSGLEHGSVSIGVFRLGDFSGSASVDYSTSDLGGPASCGSYNGKASSRCDFTPTRGTVRFEPNQIERWFTVPITEDSYVEGPEMIGLTLSNATGAALPGPAFAILKIYDDGPEPSTNPIDTADVFVRQHYLDFLNREPDGNGRVYWSNQITECQQPGATCDPEVRRVNVSAAFFLSIEFQETGYLVERIYKTGYGDADALSALDTYPNQHPIKAPIVTFSEFLPDMQQLAKDVMVGIGNWQGQLEANKVAFTQDFVTRARFVAAFPTTMTPAEFVDKLFLNAGVTPTAAERSSIIDEFGGAGTSANTTARARALRRVAENPTLNQAETNKAFVLMQYFGYLRRDPNAAPDTDHTGYDFWLHKLDQFNGNYINAEMVRAFISSIEYRQRFAP